MCTKVICHHNMKYAWFPLYTSALQSKAEWDQIGVGNLIAQSNRSHLSGAKDKLKTYEMIEQQENSMAKRSFTYISYRTFMLSYCCSHHFESFHRFSFAHMESQLNGCQSTCTQVVHIYSIYIYIDIIV